MSASLGGAAGRGICGAGAPADRGTGAKLHPAGTKMDAGAAGAGAARSRLGSERSPARSGAGVEEAAYVSHFVLVGLSSSLPRCCEESALQMKALISFSFIYIGTCSVGAERFRRPQQLFQ